MWQRVKRGVIMDFENQIEKIAKDIRDREDREMAYELVKRLSPLLIENGVTVKTTKYNLDEQVAVKEASSVDPFKKELVIHYGISIDGLDFTEHDKVFEDEIASLKRQIEKLESIRMRCHESARDSFDSGNYGCLHIVTADELKTTKDANDRTIELPFDALETANMLINATYKAEIPFWERQVDRNVYNIDDLEQIAEHLLVHCKHHKNSEE